MKCKSYFRLVQSAGRVLYALLFMMLLYGNISAQSVPKEPYISLNVSNAKLITVLDQIRKQSGWGFVYSSDLVNAQRNVTITLYHQPLSTVLKSVLENTSLTFVLDKKVVQISAKAADPKGLGEPAVLLTLKGRVTDEAGKPLHGAAIANLKNNRAVYTDADGNFELAVEEEVKVICSFTGKTARIFYAREFASSPMNVQLGAISKTLSDVVVTGYQNIDRQMVTGAITTLTPDKFMVPGATTIDAMLQGKVAGLSVVNSSGSVNASPKMRVRGTATFVGSAQPVWVVDGIVRDEPNLSPLQASQIISETDKMLQSGRDAATGIMGNAIAGVNPNDVESITFLKDASATAIYGVKAANGVIVVTTKKGTSGLRPSVNFSANFGVTAQPNYNTLNRMTSEERTDVSEEMITKAYPYQYLPNENSYEGLLTKLFNRQVTQADFQQQVQHMQTVNTDWMHLLFQPAFNQNYSLSMSGGSDKTTYYSSLSYNDNKGSAIGDAGKRYQASLRLNTQLNSKFKVDFKIQAYQRKATGFFSVNPYDYAYNTSRTIDPATFYPSNATTIQYEGGLPLSVLSYNFLNEKANSGNTNDTRQVDAMLDLRYKIIPHLEFSSLSGITYQNIESQQWAGEQSFYVAQKRGYDYGTVQAGSAAEKASPLPNGGILLYESDNNSSYTFRNTFNYNNSFRNGHHQLTAIAGMEIRSSVNKGFKDVEYGYFPDRGYRVGMEYTGTPGSSLSKHVVNIVNGTYNTLSYFSSIAYSIQQKYTFNVSVRTDASNRFGQYSNNKFLPIYSFGGKWNVAEENFLRNSSILTNFTLRATYGIQGNVVNSVGPELVATYPTTPVDILTGQYYLDLKSLAYPDLRWEKTSTTNVGVDMGFFNNRIKVTADLYNKQGKDLLIDKIVPAEIGMKSMYYNGGVLTNRGIEVMLEVTPIRTPRVSWTIGINGAKNYNLSSTRQQSIKTGTALINDYLNGNLIVDGKPVNAFYSYVFAGLNGNNGVPLFNLNPADPKSKYDPLAWLQYSGKLDPDFTGGLQTSFRYRRISLTSNFNYSAGNSKRLNPLYGTLSGSAYAPQPEKNLSKELVSRWRKPGDEAFTDIPSLTTKKASDQQVPLPLWSQNGSYGVAYQMYDRSDLRVVSGSYLRCNNLTLAYLINEAILKRSHIKSASVNFTAANLFVIADKRLNGQDPETSGFGGIALPMLRSYNFGFNLAF